MSKLKNAQSSIIDAQYLAYLIEIAADGLELRKSGRYREPPALP